ncbi:hypothetical protein AB4Z52_31965 [Rhizobium sp. 2YAF20]|uniref:hypothetical protein n=1 Tax=Rhizobium sp. 2YAF20 TaxID=3233027 RepID=UPI003F976A3B
MKHSIISYTIKPEYVEDNVRLIRAVFDELNANEPDGLRYTSLRGDGGRFVHIVERAEGSPELAEFEAFRAFQMNFGERCLVRPEVSHLAVVGSYAMMHDAS